MNDMESPEARFSNASPEENLSALFAQMVMQQSSMALMLLGKTPHPETGQVVHDVESARMFIDQLEMLEVKTKGNLDKREERMLKESLTVLRMAFVEAVERADSRPSGPDTHSPSASPPQSAVPPQTAERSDSKPQPNDEESRKKFTKKY